MEIRTEKKLVERVVDTYIAVVGRFTEGFGFSIHLVC